MKDNGKPEGPVRWPHSLLLVKEMGRRKQVETASETAQLKGRGVRPGAPLLAEGSPSLTLSPGEEQLTEASS